MNQAQRILKILDILHKETDICTYRFCEIFDIDTRTMQRDMKLLRDSLGDKLICVRRGCYALQNKSDLFAYLKDGADLKSFFEFIALFDEEQLKIFDQEQFPIIKQIKQDVKKHYHILQKPIESLKSPHLSLMKEAISQKRYANLTLKEIDKKELQEIKPQKIIFAEGNWYLAAMTKNYQLNYGFKFFRINFITDFKLLPQTFHTDVEAQKFIEDFQSLFQNYKTKTYEVKLEVDAQVARYFKVKKHLKSQQIIEKKPDGNLILTYQINNEMEIIPLIKKWIPHLRVVSPKELDDHIKDEIKQYLQN